MPSPLSPKTYPHLLSTVLYYVHTYPHCTLQVANSSSSVEAKKAVLIGIDAVQGGGGGGWIGLGLSEAGGMKGSDLWVVGPHDDLAPFMATNQVG